MRRLLLLAVFLVVLVAAGSAQGAAPASTSPPSISGVARQGDALTAGPGSWSGAPVELTYRWERCTGSPSVCEPALLSVSDGAGQPVSRYLLTGLDVGKRIRLVVEARNVEGAAEAVSAETAVVAADPGAPPENTARPSVSGLAQQGELLSAQPGSWVGAQPLVYSYRWQRCAPASYRNLVVSDGPAHYWRLGELDLWALDEVGGKTGLTKSGVLRGFAGAIAGDPGLLE